jgi:hypothetical protein
MITCYIASDLSAQVVRNAIHITSSRLHHGSLSDGYAGPAQEIADREGETVSTVVRRLIAGAVIRAKRGQPALPGIEASH